MIISMNMIISIFPQFDVITSDLVYKGKRDHISAMMVRHHPQYMTKKYDFIVYVIYGRPVKIKGGYRYKLCKNNLKSCQVWVTPYKPPSMNFHSIN